MGNNPCAQNPWVTEVGKNLAKCMIESSQQALQRPSHQEKQSPKLSIHVSHMKPGFDDNKN